MGSWLLPCPPEKQLQFFPLLLWLLQDTTHSHPTEILSPLQQEKQEFLHLNNLFDFCSRSTPCLCSLPLSMHIFKAAFYFPSAGDQEFLVGELHSWIMRGCNHTPQRALNYLPSVLEAVQITQEHRICQWNCTVSKHLAKALAELHWLHLRHWSCASWALSLSSHLCLRRSSCISDNSVRSHSCWGHQAGKLGGGFLNFIPLLFGIGIIMSCTGRSLICFLCLNLNILRYVCIVLHQCKHNQLKTPF